MSKAKLTEKMKVFNPFQYKHLIKKRYKTLFNTYFVFLLAGLILFAIILFPKTIYLGNNINNALNSFDKLSLNVTAELEGRLTVSEYPKIIIDLDNESIADSNILIGEKNLITNIWPIKKQVSMSDYSNIKNRSKPLSFLIGILAIIIFPGLLILTGIFYIIESLILVIILAFLSFIIIRTTKRDLKLRYLFKIGLLSTCVLFLFNAFFVPLLFNFWFPLIIWFLFFITAAFSCSHKIGEKEKIITKKKEKSIWKKPIKESRTNKIFKPKKSKKDDDDFIMLD